MSKMITFVCGASGHGKTTAERGSQVVTIHEGKWAVCPGGRDDGHIWNETQGISYEEMFMTSALKRSTT